MAQQQIVDDYFAHFPTLEQTLSETYRVSRMPEFVKSALHYKVLTSVAEVSLDSSHRFLKVFTLVGRQGQVIDTDSLRYVDQVIEPYPYYIYVTDDNYIVNGQAAAIALSKGLLTLDQVSVQRLMGMTLLEFVHHARLFSYHLNIHGVKQTDLGASPLELLFDPDLALINNKYGRVSNSPMA
jgi:hypothetical protein